MQVTKGIWRMREQCVPGSLSSSPAQEPGNEARKRPAALTTTFFTKCGRKGNFGILYIYVLLTLVN